MSYLLTNLSKLHPEVESFIVNSANAAGIEIHSDVNTIHLLNKDSTNNHWATLSQLEVFSNDLLLRGKENSNIKALPSDVPPSTTTNRVKETIFDIYVRNTVNNSIPHYRLHVFVSLAGARVVDVRAFLLHVPRYPNRLECYNENFNLFISDIANRYNIVLDPNHNYGCLLLDLETGQPISREKFEKFADAQTTSRIIRRANSSGRIGGRLGSTSNLRMFELIADGSGKKIVNYVLHMKDGRPYISI